MVAVRPFTGPDVNFVIFRQRALYKSEYGFTSDIWKEYLTEGVWSFVKNFDSGLDCMYILGYAGVPSGSIAITHAGESTAQLRFFFLEPAIRGQGAGRLLMDMAIDFCKEKRYERVFLWTFSTLPAARHLYDRKGFWITDVHENADWGEKILEERWDLLLSVKKTDGYHLDFYFSGGCLTSVLTKSCPLTDPPW